MIAAGLDGIQNQRSAGQRRDNDNYAHPLPEAEVRRLPQNLLDALRALRQNEALAAALGEPFITAFTKLKEREWCEHHAHISAWERQATLDC